jgi:hypothetical protein
MLFISVEKARSVYVRTCPSFSVLSRLRLCGSLIRRLLTLTTREAAQGNRRSAASSQLVKPVPAAILRPSVGMGGDAQSRGWDFEMINHRRVNSAGWVNDQDYHKDDDAPLLAIIGDSYVEALMVPYVKTLLRASGQ